MTRKSVFSPVVLSAIGLVAVVGALALAQQAKEGHAGGQPAMNLPPGWSEADMQACMLAGMPGEPHALLAKTVGEWQGEGEMWMAPDTEPMPYECTSTITTEMDGRFVKCEFHGDLPGMGPFHGVGYNGFDNVSQQYVSTWIDNHGTGIMYGTGERTADGRTITWHYKYNCPVTKKPAKMQQIERITGDNTMTMEIHMADPKSGKEYKMLSLNFTRKPGTGGMAGKAKPSGTR